MRKIRFDDREALRAEISDGYGRWGEPRRVSQEMVHRFAELTGDCQWIHVDVERARCESPFGGPIAHGFLTLSLISSLDIPADFELVGYGVALNFGADRLRFIAPVPCDSEVRARARITRVHVGGAGTLVKRDIQVGLVASDQPVLEYRGLTLFRPPQQ